MHRIKGNQTVLSGKPATKVVSMDTLTDCSEDLCGSDVDSDFEPEEQDIGMLTEDEEEEVPISKKGKSQLNKGYPANDRRGTHTINVFEFLCLITKQFIGVFQVIKKATIIFRGVYLF